jgi:hypothetical protein
VVHFVLLVAGFVAGRVLQRRRTKDEVCDL